MSNISNEDLKRLFPAPTMGSTPYSRTLLPGCTSDSSEALAELLRRNFNFRQPINDPISQQLFAIWASGGTRSLLQAANDAPAPGPPDISSIPADININNWTGHLGNPAYFASFRRFFVEQILDPTNTFESLLDTLVFSLPTQPTTVSMATPLAQDVATGPHIFAMGPHVFVSSNIMGLATEFDNPGMLVDGLALAAVSSPMISTTLPQARLLNFSLDNNAVSDGENRTAASTTSRVDEGYLSESEDIKAKTLQPTVSSPIITVTNADNVKKRIRMLGFLATMIYGVGGLQGEPPFRADFDLMNLVTASFFNHSLLKYLSETNQSLLLTSFTTLALQMWAKAGSPSIDIANFYREGYSTANPQPPGCIPVSHKSVLDPGNPTPNSFYPILKSAIKHPDSHLTKVQRALSLFSMWYGTTPPGTFTVDDFPSGDDAPVLTGIDRLDGTLFVRVAGLTADRLGWVREGEAPGEWDGE